MTGNPRMFSARPEEVFPGDHGPKAAALEEEALGVLIKLTGQPHISSAAPEFINTFLRYTTLLTRFQDAVLEHHNRRVSCKRGCAACCCHWVDDVYNFETAIIADYLKVRFPGRVAAIHKTLIEDARQMDTVRNATITTCTAHNITDPDDIAFTALSAFFGLQRPCPLLDNDGRCLVYPLRPLTCRIYFSFSSAQLCKPVDDSDEIAMTFTLDFGPKVQDLLEEINRRIDMDDTDRWLRTQLLNHLTKRI